MRPVNTAFMYTGERANPSVHSRLTGHLKGHLIHTNDLVDNRMKEKRGCGGLKRTATLERMHEAHVNTKTVLALCLRLHFSSPPSLPFPVLPSASVEFLARSPIPSLPLPLTLIARSGSCGAGRHSLKHLSTTQFISQSGSERQESCLNSLAMLLCSSLS